MKTLKAIFVSVVAVLTLASCKKEEVKNCSQGIVVSKEYLGEEWGYTLNLKNVCSGNVENFPINYIEEYKGELFDQESVDFSYSVQVGDTYTVRNFGPSGDIIYYTW